MTTNLTGSTISYLEKNLYSKLNQCPPTLGRFYSIPVSLLDVALTTSFLLLHTIECVALASINLFGAAFSAKYTLKNALLLTETALVAFMGIPVKLAFAPIKIVFQFFAIMIDPQKVQPIGLASPSFKA